MTLKTGFSSAFRLVTGMGRSHKPATPVAKPAAPSQDSASALKPLATASSSTAPMAPRGKLPPRAPWITAGQKAHPLPRPPNVLPTPEQLGLPRQAEQKLTLPTPEQIGVPRQAEQRPMQPTFHKLHPTARQSLEEIESYPLPTPKQATLGDLLRLETEAEKAATVIEARTKEPINSLPLETEAEEAAKVIEARKKKRINSLPSAPKIDLTKTPDAHLENLPLEQLRSLVRGLGAGELVEIHPQVRDAQIEIASMKLENIKFDRFSEIDWKKDIQGKRLWTELPPYKQERLEQAAHVAHMSIRQWDIVDEETGARKTRMDIYFGGTLNGRDAGQDLKTAIGGVGEVYKATRQVAELVAEAMAANPSLEINRVMGFSMGGGTAQAFLAGVESRIELQNEPVLVAFDPQLLNDAQAKHAIKGGPLGYDYGKPRGVAVTLDYEAAPHKGLMNIMKGPGRYKSPGLVQLRLGLKDDDGVKYVKQKDPVSGAVVKDAKGEEVWKRFSVPPTVSGPPGLGYHDNTNLYMKALDRFTTRTAPDFTSVLADDYEDGYEDMQFDDNPIGNALPWSPEPHAVTPEAQVSWTRSDTFTTDDRPSWLRTETFTTDGRPSLPGSETTTPDNQPSAGRNDPMTKGKQAPWMRSETMTPDNQPYSGRDDAVKHSDQQHLRSEIEQQRSPMNEGR